MDPPLGGVTVDLEIHSCLEHSSCKWQEYIEDRLVVGNVTQAFASVYRVAIVNNPPVVLGSDLDDVIPDQDIFLLSWVK